MKVNLFIRTVKIVPVEVPDEMMTNIIFDNRKENWDKRPLTALADDRNDYQVLIDYIYEHYRYDFEDDYEYAEAETAEGEIIPVLEY